MSKPKIDVAKAFRGLKEAQHYRHFALVQTDYDYGTKWRSGTNTSQEGFMHDNGRRLLANR